MPNPDPGLVLLILGRNTCLVLPWIGNSVLTLILTLKRKLRQNTYPNPICKRVAALLCYFAC